MLFLPLLLIGEFKGRSMEEVKDGAFVNATSATFGVIRDTSGSESSQ
jgi:hypothetical protein